MGNVPLCNGFWYDVKYHSFSAKCQVVKIQKEVFSSCGIAGLCWLIVSLILVSTLSLFTLAGFFFFFSKSFSQTKSPGAMFNLSPDQSKWADGPHFRCHQAWERLKNRTQNMGHSWTVRHLKMGQSSNILGLKVRLYNVLDDFVWAVDFCKIPRTLPPNDYPSESATFQ